MDELDQIDPETGRLINELLTRLGILMEAASTPALLKDSCDGSLAERVIVLEVEITRMKSISDAAKAPCCKLDSQARALKCEHVIKLLLAIAIALSLFGSPAASRSAPSVGCSMPGADHGQAVDHEKMGCCTPDCAAPAPSAMLPSGPLGAAAIEPNRIAVWIPTYLELVPTNPAAADPPPRAFQV